MPNKFSKLGSIPDKEEIENLVGNIEYRRIGINELPENIRSNGLTEKCNSFILAASGSTDGMLYAFVGIRPDGPNIDEHPFVYYYDYHDESKNFGGIIHHGNWDDRTTPLNQEQLIAISQSGITASFTYKDIPPGASGSLYDLNENGMLEGITVQFREFLSNQEKE